MPATREAVNQASAMAEADLSLEKGVIRGPSTASPVHAAAVNGDKAALQKLIAGSPELKDEEDRLGRTPLMYCVLADRLDCAVLLLKAGADVNKADRSQRSALHMAAQKGNYRIMKLLLVRRANWMQKDLEETTPLHLATRHKSAKCLALLLKHMAPGEVDSQDRNKQTALHWSAYHNNPEHGRLLVKHNSNIGIPDVEGRIPLHWAAHSQDPSAVHMVRCILDAAPTESLLNWQDYEGRTPLHFAVADGNEAVVDVLTSYAGCNVTSYDNLFRTPLHWAALLGHARIAHLLLERNRSSAIPSDGQGATPLHYAAQSNFPETVEVFLRHPSVKDDTDLEGRTAFMWAAGKGSDAVIRAMLALKPDLDINLADSYGGTALHAASLSGHVSTVRLLLERGVRVDATDVMNHTPLFRACEMGHKEVIQTLIEGGARVDLVDQDGHSPLHWAALGGNANVCQILIENKINPNVQDSAGRTPLQCAAYGGYINCMAVLMENKADTNIQDKEGRTALHWSCNNGYLDAVKLLLAFDAFPNQMENNEERYTPLDYALLGEHHEVIQFMLERGALSIAAIQDIAASKIQAIYKGYKVRKAFQDRKILLMKHEQLRKDAAAKKREEGHKRREALGDGKGVQSQTGPVIEGHQPPARREDSGVPWQLLGGEEADSASTSPRSQEEESNDGSPRAAKNKSPPKEPSPPSEDGKRKKGGPRRSSKGRSTGVYLDSGGGAKEDPQCTSSEVSMPVSSRRKGRTHRDQSVDAHGEGPPGSKSQVLGLPLEGPNQTSQDSSCQYENMAKCLESMSFSGGNPKSSKPGHLGKTVPRPKQGKDAATQVLDGGRCSPAGSSRPCSAKRGSGKGINNGAKGSSTPQSHVSPCPLGPAVAAGCAPGDVAMPSLPGQITNLEKTHAAGTAFRLCSPVSWQSQNIEAIPAAIRLAVIERERARKDLFRKKVHAAEVIQEGWRHYRLRQELSLLLNTERCGAEADDRWRRQTMACVVRLAWRKRLDQSPVPLIAPCRSRLSQAPPLPAGQSPVFSRPSGRRAPTKSAKLPPTALQQVYGSSQEGKRRRPCRLPSRHRLSARDLILGGH